jgi:hypothetical protein
LAIVVGGIAWTTFGRIELPHGLEATLTAHGDVSVQRAGQTRSVDEMESFAVQPGDLIVCGLGASGHLRYVDSTVIALSEGAKLILNDAADVANGKHIDLKHGVVDATVAKQPVGRPMIITTPQACVSVVGTTFTLACEPAMTRLDMIEGEVSLQGVRTGESLRVTGGYFCEIGDNSDRIFKLRRLAAGSSPFGGTAWVIPGIIEAENYDLGGEGVAYHDTGLRNLGQTYREDGVDVCDEYIVKMTDAPFIGWTKSGEWLQYSVDVAAPGIYTLDMRVSAWDSGGIFHIEFDGIDKTGPIAMPTHADRLNQSLPLAWQTLTTKVQLSAGHQAMTIVFDKNGAHDFEVANLNYVHLTPASETP